MDAFEVAEREGKGSGGEVPLESGALGLDAGLSNGLDPPGWSLPDPEEPPVSPPVPDNKHTTVSCKRMAQTVVYVNNRRRMDWREGNSEWNRNVYNKR